MVCTYVLSAYIYRNVYGKHVYIDYISIIEIIIIRIYYSLRVLEYRNYNISNLNCTHVMYVYNKTYTFLNVFEYK